MVSADGVCVHAPLGPPLTGGRALELEWPLSTPDGSAAFVARWPFILMLAIKSYLLLAVVYWGVIEVLFNPRPNSNPRERDSN
jgi:hypothetical protein